jgi:hypothetical protein
MDVSGRGVVFWVKWLGPVEEVPLRRFAWGPRP